MASGPSMADLEPGNPMLAPIPPVLRDFQLGHA